MIFSTSQNSINKLLKKFYQPKSYLLTPMSDQLQKMMRLIGHYKSDERAQVGRMIQEIQRLLTKNKQAVKNRTNPYWLIVFKSMLLIHELLTLGILGNTFQETLSIIYQSLNHINQLNLKEIHQFHEQLTKKPTSLPLLEQQKQAIFEQQIIYSKFLKPYYNYLSRRCQMLPKGFSQKSKCYYLINLLSTASSCNEVIYMFGRYNKLDEFFVMGDFNLTLAKDIFLLYGLMRQCIDFGQIKENNKDQQSMVNRVKNETVTKKNEKLHISEVDDILLQTHQKLYHIFYNKYNHRKTQHYIPDWINLDKYQNKSKSHLNMKLEMTRINNMNNNNKSFINISKFYDEDERLALDQTACSIAGEKQLRQSNYKMNSSQLYSRNNNNISAEVRQQSLQIIHDLQEFLEKFDENV